MRQTIATLLVLVPGCKQIFDLEGPARIPPDAAIDAAVACSSDPQCPPAASHCATAQGICVECLVASHCTSPDAPQCDPDTRTCRGCLKHSDCPSNACLPDGTCGNDSTVTYVDPLGSDVYVCTRAEPCLTIERAHALVTATRRFVKLSGALFPANRLQLDSVMAVWLADPGTTLTQAAGDPLIDLSKSNLAVYDLEVICTQQRAFRFSSDSTLRLHGVNIHGCTKLAIEANGGAFVIDRSQIANNGGGITTGSGVFTITNSFFTRNGNEGAVVIEGSTTLSSRFEFNTVVDNMANTGSTAGKTGGVECTSSNTMPVLNNIIARNTGYRDNVFGGCDFSGSIITDLVAPLAFVSPDAAPYNYHLGAQSVAIDAASATTLAVDFDGQSRPVGDESDMGADEYSP